MVTLTLRHDRHDPLPLLVDTLKDAWRRVKMGKGWLTFTAKHAVSGLVTAFELTHGSSGWHPHLHVLVFVRPGMAFGKFRFDIKRRWLLALENLGADATWEHGCNVVAAKGDIADYVAKWGKEPSWTVAHELAKSVSKRGRMNGQTPTELLFAYVEKADQVAGYLWQDYAVSMKGRNQLTWTRGLRALLGLGEMKSDEQLAAEHVERAIKVASLTLHQWRVILDNDARGELLNAAADGDSLAVALFLEKLDLILPLDRIDDNLGELGGRPIVQLALIPAGEVVPSHAKRPLPNSHVGCQEPAIGAAKAARLLALDNDD